MSSRNGRQHPWSVSYQMAAVSCAVKQNGVIFLEKSTISKNPTIHPSQSWRWQLQVQANLPSQYLCLIRTSTVSLVNFCPRQGHILWPCGECHPFVEDLTQVHEMLHHYYMAFHLTVQEPNLPKGQHQPACAHRSRQATSHGVSQGASSDHSHSPNTPAPAPHHCSPFPSVPCHVRSFSGSSLDNYSKGI